MNIELIKLLKENLYQPITTELAADICMAAGSLSRLVTVEDLVQTKPETDNGMTFALERMENILDELKLLHEIHWAETEEYRHEIPLNPDYSEFIRHERAGRYMVFTLRREERLLGNFSLFVAKSHQTQTLIGSEDTLYVMPEVRKSGAARGLVSYGERALHRMGVRQITASVKLVNNAGVFLKRMGYEHVAEGYSKILEAQNAS